MTVMKSGITMRNEIVRCERPMMALVSSDQWKLYLFDHHYER